MTGDQQKQWLLGYLERYRQVLIQEEILQSMLRLKALFQGCSAAGKKAIFAGNGGSAAIASHCAVDFTKNAGIRSVNFNEADLITCFANDYGYEHWLKKALEFYADSGDVAVLISASGKSPNMVEAGRFARERGLPLVTFTGFGMDNPLKALGEINFWVDSRAYNVVEMTHQIWLLAVCDLIIGKAEYPARREIDYAFNP
jgi:D-sedoheptulose 7-phosphate isomerase